jgi:esterase/lipase
MRVTLSSEGGDKKEQGQVTGRSSQGSRRRRSSGGRKPAQDRNAKDRPARRTGGRPDARRSSRGPQSNQPRNAPAPPVQAPVATAPVAAAAPAAPAPRPFSPDPSISALTLSAWDLARTRKQQPDTSRGQIMTLRTHQKLLAGFEDERGIAENDRSYLRVNDGSTGSCLFIHGVSTSPGDLKELADEFYQAGFNIYVLRLPDYGTPENTLSEITWESALNQAQQCFQLLARGGGKVHVVGLGFGATLALHVALRENVTSLVLLAPAIMPRESFLQRLVVRLKLHHLKFVHRWLGWNADLMEGMDLARGKMGKIKVPIYAAQCEDDDRASPDSLRFLQRKARNRSSRFQIFPEGGHDVLQAHGKEVLNKEVLRFCGARSG